MSDSRAGTPAQPSDLVDVAHLVTAYYTRRPRPERPRPAGRVRHVGPPRQQPAERLQRGAHRRDHAGDLRLPQGTGVRRPAVRRTRHPRPLGARLGQRAGGARRQRRDGARRRPRRLHADPGGVARDPAGQPRQALRPGQGLADGIVVTPSHNPPARRRLQVQPAQRRAGRHRRHEVDRRRGQRLHRGLARRGEAGAVRAGPGRRVVVRLPRDLRRRPAERRRPGRGQGGRGPHRRRPARGRASTTGARSPTGTAST